MRLLIIILLLTGSLFAQGSGRDRSESSITRILFIFDASNSMTGHWDYSTKIQIAKKLLKKTIDELEVLPNVQVALRVYGHQSYVYPGHQDCSDTKLEVPFRWINHQKIKDKIDEIQCKGTTPIALSLEQSAEDFPSKESRNIIILITDGIEACDGDPCAVSKALKSKGITVKPFVVGIGIDLEYLKAFNCIGNVFDAKDEESFDNIMKLVVEQAITNTTVQVNLNNTAGEPKETNVPVTFKENVNESTKYAFIHTLNEYGVPDTLSIDPLLKYEVTAHTLPPVTKQEVRIAPGQHNTITLNTPMGSLSLDLSGSYNSYKKLKCVVRESGKGETVFGQDFGTTVRYLTGSYDLEILSNPRIYFKDVAIKQSETYRVMIPGPGTLNYSTSVLGYASIFKVNGSELEWVINVDENRLNQDIPLQPGKYLLIYRSLVSKQSIYSIKKEFEISTDMGTSVRI